MPDIVIDMPSEECCNQSSGWRVACSIYRILTTFAARRGQREALQHLDDRLLADIGRTREEARAESSKPFWR